MSTIRSERLLKRTWRVSHTVTCSWISQAVVIMDLAAVNLKDRGLVNRRTQQDEKCLGAGQMSGPRLLLSLYCAGSQSASQQRLSEFNGN